MSITERFCVLMAFVAMGALAQHAVRPDRGAVCFRAEQGDGGTWTWTGLPALRVDGGTEVPHHPLNLKVPDTLVREGRFLLRVQSNGRCAALSASCGECEAGTCAIVTDLPCPRWATHE
jgi:hypothetical protein